MKNLLTLCIAFFVCVSCVEMPPPEPEIPTPPVETGPPEIVLPVMPVCNSSVCALTVPALNTNDFSSIWQCEYYSSSGLLLFRSHPTKAQATIRTVNLGLEGVGLTETIKCESTKGVKAERNKD